MPRTSQLSLQPAFSAAQNLGSTSYDDLPSVGRGPGSAPSIDSMSRAPSAPARDWHTQLTGIHHARHELHQGGSRGLIYSTGIGLTTGLLSVFAFYAARAGYDVVADKPVFSRINPRNLAIEIAVPVAAWAVGLSIGLAIKYARTSRQDAVKKLEKLAGALEAQQQGGGLDSEARSVLQTARHVLRFGKCTPGADLAAVLMGTAFAPLWTLGGALAITAVALVCVLFVACAEGGAEGVDCSGCGYWGFWGPPVPTCEPGEVSCCPKVPYRAKPTPPPEGWEEV